MCDYQFVGDLFSDVFTDGLCPSVIPHSVVTSVEKTKKPFAGGFTDGICAAKKKVSLLKYTNGFYSVGDIVIDRRLRTVGKVFGEYLKYRPNISVCKFFGNCGSYCQMLMDSFRR